MVVFRVVTAWNIDRVIYVDRSHGYAPVLKRPALERGKVKVRLHSRTLNATRI